MPPEHGHRPIDGIAGGDLLQRLGRRAEQQLVHQGLVLPGDASDGFGQGEHHVKVTHRQQLAATGFQPLAARGRLALGTVPVAARVVRHLAVPAFIALLDVSAQGGSAAGGQRLQHELLVEGQAGAALAEEFGAVLADDVAEFESRAAGGKIRRGSSEARASKGLAVLRSRDIERCV